MRKIRPSTLLAAIVVAWLASACARSPSPPHPAARSDASARSGRADAGSPDAGAEPAGGSHSPDSGAGGGSSWLARDASGSPDRAVPMDAAVPTFDAGKVTWDAAADAAPTAMPQPCEIAAPTSCPAPPTTYEDVAPIFAERCVICHSDDPNGPWPLNAYQHVVDWKDNIRSDMLDCSMPPRDAGLPMTREERLAILTWIRCGVPQ